MAYVPNIVSGIVTNRASAERPRTPNWLKAIYATLATILVLFGLAIVFAPDSPQQVPAKHPTAVCDRK